VSTPTTGKRVRLPRVGALRTVGEIARMMGRPYRSTLRLLVSMAKRDVDDGMPPERVWLVDPGRGKVKLVNLQRLHAAHPALFERRYVSREEYDDLARMVTEVRTELHQLRQRYRALAARTR
jgi:hypothetical protein